MTRLLPRLLFLLLLVLPQAAGALQSKEIDTDITRIRLVSAVDKAAAGEKFWVAIKLELDRGWHTYTDPPGDAGLPLVADWEVTGGSAGPINWPPAKDFAEDIFTTHGYDGEVWLPVEITPDQKAKSSKIALNASLSWMVCKEMCIPEEAKLSLEIPLAKTSKSSEFADKIISVAKAALPASETPNLMAEQSLENVELHNLSDDITLPIALLFAFIGGFILNLMPCVFPVLSLKCLALLKHKDNPHAHTRMEALFYTGGILACFTILAGLLLALKAGGENIGWGFQMQSPVFVFLMALVMFLVALNLSDLFSLPVLLGRAGSTLTNDRSMRASFFTGLLAAAVATPCTAPLMAPAVGYALTQPPIVAVLILEALGLGLAAPFLLIGFFPRLAALLPRPGHWMVTLRRILAFPMYISAVWLLWVLQQQIGLEGLIISIIALVAISALLWWQSGWSEPSVQRRAITLTVLFAAIVAAIVVIRSLPEPKEESHLLHYGQAFNADTLKRLRINNQPVFVDVTAAWCITCRVNFASTLSRDVVRREFEVNGVELLVADWTRRNPEITEYLRSFGASGVPLYVYYPPGGKPVVLPQILTPRIVIDTVRH